MRYIVSIPVDYLKTTLRLLGTRALLMRCAVPYVVGLVSFLGVWITGIFYRNEIVAWFFDLESNWLSILGAFGAVVLAFFAASIAAVLLVSIIGGVFIEGIAEFFLREGGIRAPEHTGVLSIAKSVLRGFKDDVLRLVYIAVISVLLLLTGFFPLLAFFPILVGAFMVGWDLVDLSFALLEVPFKERWRLVKAHWGQVTVLGGTFLVVALIPLGAIIAYPIGHAVAAKRIATWDSALIVRDQPKS